MFRLVELAVFPAAIAHAEFIERYVTPWREFNLDKSINSIWNRRNGGVGHRENKNKINIHLAGRLFAVEPDFSSISFVRGLSLWSDKGSAGKSVEKFPRGQRTRGKPEIMVVSPGSCVLTGVARGSYQNQLHLRASLVRKKKDVISWLLERKKETVERKGRPLTIFCFIYPSLLRVCIAF